MYKQRFYNKKQQQYLPQYGMGDWIKKNAGPIMSVAGTVGGMALGSLAGPAGASLGASIGGQLGGAIGNPISQDYQNDENIEAMKQQQAQQNQAARLNIARQNFANSQQLQKFKTGGAIPPSGNTNNVIDPNTYSKANIGRVNAEDLARVNMGRKPKINYANPQPFTAIDGTQYYVTPQDVNRMAGDDRFKPFESGYVYYTDSSLTPDFGAIRGYDYDNKNNTISYQANYAGQSDRFKNAFNKKIDLNNLPPRAMGGLLNYEGQTHNGPQGGIPVDSNGSPSIVSKRKPVGLTENKESAWKSPKSGKTYIFSDQLIIP